jgi:hypothetical protein
MRKYIRKIVSTMLIGGMLFFAPSMIPARAVQAITTCGTVWLPNDLAFAAGPAPPCPVPSTSHAHVPAWPWVVVGCAASIVVSAVVANAVNNRQLTTPEAWTCGLLYWWYPWAYPQQPAKNHH